MTPRILITWFTMQISASNIDQTGEQDGIDVAIGLEYNKSAL